MVSIDRITQKFIQLDEYLEILRSISNTPLEDFLKDAILLGSAKDYLQISIECCLDVVNHIIASERYRAPKDYADSFKVIEEEKLITAEFGEKLRQMAKFRNRLVHLYGEVENSYVYQFIQEDLSDIEKLRILLLKRYIPK